MNWPAADPITTVQRLFVLGLHFLRRKILKSTRRAAQADQGCVAARAAVASETARPISGARCKLGLSGVSCGIARASQLRVGHRQVTIIEREPGPVLRPHTRRAILNGISFRPSGPGGAKRSSPVAQRIQGIELLRERAGV